jgi:uncharacterized membrane protein YdfJ with MMPL/SSD domain
MEVVLTGRPGSVAAMRLALVRVARAVRKVPYLSLTPQTLTRAQTDTGRGLVVIPLNVSATTNEAIDVAKRLRGMLHVGETTNGVVTYVIGQQALYAALEDVAEQDLHKAEAAGFPLVLLVLLAVVGSLAAALLPLGLGVASAVVTGAGIFFLSQQLQMSVFVTNLASLLGIGVAVDYSLFILARYREEIRAGATLDQARGNAMRTSGLAVAFSGFTVLIALAGLFLVNSQTLRSMAVGALLVVAVSVVAALTLLPALISLLGARIYEPGRYVERVKAGLRAGSRKLRPRRSELSAPHGDLWVAWTRRLMARPALFASLAAAAMLTIAIPALSLKWGNAALYELPGNNEARIGVEEAARLSGPGALEPVQAVITFRHGTLALTPNRAAVSRYVRAVRRLAGVASVSPPQRSREGGSVLVAIAPSMDPESPQADHLISQLRAPGGVSARLLPAATVAVGGAAALNVDFNALVSGSLWKVFLFVIALTYLVLLILLRSVLLPLKAVAMNLLTVAAAYGVLVAVFQYGWFDRLTGYHALGYVHGTTPALVLSVVFGLSMDYEVFLLSRIRERYDATGDTSWAVAQGLASSAPVISSAALIMVLVFSVFAIVGLPSVKEIGVGLAVAIALDATIVRLVLVPATMALMGRFNWWLPGWLDRILPQTDFEAPVERQVTVDERPPAIVGELD